MDELELMQLQAAEEYLKNKREMKAATIHYSYKETYNHIVQFLPSFKKEIAIYDEIHG